jgi:hypothetical protein
MGEDQSRDINGYEGSLVVFLEGKERKGRKEAVRVTRLKVRDDSEPHPNSTSIINVNCFLDVKRRNLR